MVCFHTTITLLYTNVTLSSHYRHTIVILMVPFERSLSQLSEKHKIFDFRPTEFKLWQLKDSQNQIKRMGVTVIKS